MPRKPATKPAARFKAPPEQFSIETMKIGDVLAIQWNDELKLIELQQDGRRFLVCETTTRKFAKRIA